MCRSLPRVLAVTTTLGGLWALPAIAPAAEGRPEKLGRKHTGFGLGVSAGDPMGATVKYFIRPQHALQGHVAWGLAHHGDGLIIVDYMWHTPTVGESPIVDASFYFGGGLGVAFWAMPGPARLQAHEQASERGAAMMIRAPVLGLAFHWAEVPLDTVLETSWSPYVVMPDLLHFDGSIKVRYYF